LALVRSGDIISIDVAQRSIHLEISDTEMQRRKDQWKPQARRYERGYGWMFSRHIQQADQGCDFDFLETGFGAPVTEPDIY
jgi:dihydroxy-acid dehydratase